MKVAVLSDLHIGPNVRGKDLFDPPGKAAIDDDFLDQFEEFVIREDAKADYLLVAGDLSESARPDELRQAGTVIARVAKALGVAEDRVSLTIGNHDKFWAPLDFDPGDTTGITQQMAYMPISRAPGLVAEAMAREAQLTSRCWSVTEQPDIVIIAYNSTWADGPKVKPHYGAIDPAHADQMRGQLSYLRDDDRFKVLLVHHHAWQYADRIQLPDFSVMDNAQALLELTADLRIDFLVHGHKHVPRFQVALTGDRHHLCVLGAGSFCKNLESVLQGEALNQFHLIEVTGRDSQSNRSTGNVKSWSFTTTAGWTRSRVDVTGIEHHNPFGCYATPEEIRDRARPEVERRLAGGSHATWREVIAQDPTLDGVPAKVVLSVLEMLQAEGTLDRFLRQDDGDCVLLGKRA